MTTLLVSAIGGDIGRSVAKIVREVRPEIRLVGVDMESRHCGKLYVDEFQVVPAAVDPSYVAVMRSIVRRLDIDAIVPINERELSVLTRFGEDFYGAHLFHCGRDIVEIGLDKLRTMETLRSLGIAVPWTVDSNIQSPIDLPCIMKPRFSSGSRSILRIETKEEVEFYSKRNKNHVFQELLDPYEREVTCAVYRTYDGEIFSIQFERLLVGGLTEWAVVIDDGEIGRILRRIANGLDLKGSINVQLRITKRGPRIFEINPRFSSTVLMRHRLGFCDAIWSFQEYEGMRIEFDGIKVGSVVVRTQDAVVMS